MEPHSTLTLAAGNSWGILAVFAVLAVLSAINKLREWIIKQRQQREQAFRPQQMPRQQQPQPSQQQRRPSPMRRMQTEDFEDDEQAPAAGMHQLPTGVQQMPSGQQLPRRPIPPTPRPVRRRAPVREVTPEIIQQPAPQAQLVNINQQIDVAQQRLALLQTRREQLTAQQTPGSLAQHIEAPADEALILRHALRNTNTARQAIILMEIFSPPLAMREE